MTARADRDRFVPQAPYMDDRDGSRKVLFVKANILASIHGNILLWALTLECAGTALLSRPVRPGEVGVELMHLFTEAATAATHPGGLVSPIVKSTSALTSARATQVAAARALSRVAAASDACRRTVIRLARDPQLLARLVSLSAEEMEVGNGVE